MNTSPMAFGAINPFNFNTPVATPQSVQLSQTVAMSNFTGSRLDSFVENSPVLPIVTPRRSEPMWANRVWAKATGRGTRQPLTAISTSF